MIRRLASITVGLLGLLWITSAQAQQIVPGYMGKRLFLEGGSSFGLRHEGGRQFAGLSISGQLRGQYVWRRNMVVHLGYGYTNAVAGVTHLILEFPSLEQSLYEANYRTHFHSAQLGLDFYWNKKRRAAPQGFYNTIGLYGLWTAGLVLDDDLASFDFAEAIQPVPLFLVGVEVVFGYRVVLNDYLLLAVAARHVLFPDALGQNGNQAVVYSSAGYQNKNNYESMVKAYLQQHYALGLQLTLGVFITR